MSALVEFHDPANLARVLASGADLVGINNRDLTTVRHRPRAHAPAPRPDPAGGRAGQRERHPHPGRRRAARGGRRLGHPRRRIPDAPARHRPGRRAAARAGGGVGRCGSTSKPICDAIESRHCRRDFGRATDDLLAPDPRIRSGITGSIRGLSSTSIPSVNRTIVNLVLSEPGDANPTNLGKFGTSGI